MRMSVKLKGLDKIVDKLDALDGAHQTQALRDGLAAGGLVAVEEARTRVPVRTGNLRDSLHVGGYTALTPSYRKIGRYGALRKPQGSGKGVMVFLGSTMPHAHLVERGTRKMAARAYMRPAIDTKQKEILRKVDDSVQQVIDEG
jgi:HK97 gp10 family phage protein